MRARQVLTDIQTRAVARPSIQFDTLAEKFEKLRKRWGCVFC